MSTSEQTTSIELSPALTPVLSDRFVARWSHVAITSVFAVLFLYLCYVPLSHAEIWRHVSEGHWMVANGRLPQSDPLFEFAAGMPYQNHAWLSQVILAWGDTVGGSHALSAVYAALQFTSLVILAIVYFRLSGSKLIATIGVLLICLIGIEAHGKFTPSSIAFLPLVVLLALTTTRTPRQPAVAVARWLAIPLVIAIWANLDASFVVGLALVWILALGRAIDCWWRTGSLIAAVRSRRVRQGVWLAEASLLATLLQPHGVKIWQSALSGGTESLWISLGGLQPLVLVSWAGFGFLSIWAIALCVLRLSPRRIRTSDALVMIAGTLATGLNSNLLPFFAPVALTVLMPHLGAITRRIKPVRRRPSALPRKPESDNASFKFALTLICGLIVWVAFSLSPLSQPVLGGKSRRIDQLHSVETPLGVSQYLSASDTAAGLTWAPAYWGDWLAYTQSKDCRLFAGSRRSSLPRQVRHDYGRIFRGEGSWEKILDRYGVETLIADKSQQDDLISMANRHDSAWRVAYEDEQSVVFVRRIPDAQRARRSSS